MSPKCFCNSMHPFCIVGLHWHLGSVNLDTQYVHIALYTPLCSVGPTETAWNTSAVIGDRGIWWRMVFNNTYDVFSFLRNTIKLQKTKTVFFYCHLSTCKYQITELLNGLCPNVLIFFLNAFRCWEGACMGTQVQFPRTGKRNLLFEFELQFSFIRKRNWIDVCLGIRIEFPTISELSLPGFCHSVPHVCVKQSSQPWQL